ncbi:MAG: bile acid:sodium symporter family protein [Bacteroidales bacterium]|nr:bile acid:sodium symporter family protein [Bacteroidales bacterium]
MNSVFIVLPVLTLLMFNLGLNLRLGDFVFLFKNPKSVLAGLFGQLVLLPLAAFLVVSLFSLKGVFLIGLMLIACCPGGSSSNIFSLIAKGDVALSVSLTALSSIITLFTLPFIMNGVTSYAGVQAGVSLPVGNLIIQNILFTFLPIVLGMLLRYKKENLAQKIEKPLSKLAFPLLMFLAGVFFVQNYRVIADNILLLGACVLTLLASALVLAFLLSLITGLNIKQQRTVIIEVGMQNAAQAIAIASSPFVFNNPQIAVPSIIYALLMNVVLLIYVAFVKAKK